MILSLVGKFNFEVRSLIHKIYENVLFNKCVGWESDEKSISFAPRYFVVVVR